MSSFQSNMPIFPATARERHLVFSHSCAGILPGPNQNEPSKKHTLKRRPSACCPHHPSQNCSVSIDSSLVLHTLCQSCSHLILPGKAIVKCGRAYSSLNINWEETMTRIWTKDTFETLHMSTHTQRHFTCPHTQTLHTSTHTETLHTSTQHIQTHFTNRGTDTHFAPCMNR